MQLNDNDETKAGDLLVVLAIQLFSDQFHAGGDNGEHAAMIAALTNTRLATKAQSSYRVVMPLMAMADVIE